MPSSLRCCIGDQGRRGPQGFPGQNTYVSGAAGFQGRSGNVGFQGTRGQDGTQGLDGPQGYQQLYVRGVVGPQGERYKSDTIDGPQGTVGGQGPVGYQGQPFLVTRGFQGPNGRQGGDGAQGEIGQRGPQGATNLEPPAQGPQGDLGPQGAQLAFLYGMQGIKGLVGRIQQEIGAQGLVGTQGTIGGDALGFQGFRGDAGVQGIAGIDSDVAGWQGNRGAQGSEGSPGEPIYGLRFATIQPNVTSIFFANAGTQSIFNPFQSFVGLRASSALYLFSMTLRCPFSDFVVLTLTLRSQQTVFAQSRYTIRAATTVAMPCFLHAVVENVTPDMEVSIYLTCDQPTVVVMLSAAGVFSVQYKD